MTDPRAMPAGPRGGPCARVSTWCYFAVSVMVLSTLIVAFPSGMSLPLSSVSSLPRGVLATSTEAPGPSSGTPYAPLDPSAPAYAPSSAESAPLVSFLNPPHLTTAIRDAPSTIYTYKNQQEQVPQDSKVTLWVNATGGSVPTYANVQVVFVVETTLYDGVYDPTSYDSGVNNPCNGPCQESNAVPFFVANSGTIASNIAANNPYSTVSFAMVDYFATLTDHDDGDGAEYHVDVGNFVPAGNFQSAVVSGFQNPVLGGNWYYSDSDFSDSFLDSSSITALYGALKGSNLAWNPSDHHVIVLVTSAAPRDGNYSVNYAYSHSDTNSGNSSNCEPSYPFGGGLSSPNCEAWTTGTNNIASLARGLGVNIDVIDLANGLTNGASQDYTSTAGGTADANAILHAGCDLAKATGGSWEGPTGYSCSASSTGTGLGNLTCTQGSSCFQGQNGNSYANPPRSWASNTPLGWAIDHISFGPSSVSNVTASSNGAPMFQFVPALNLTPDPSNPGWSVTCLRAGTPLTGCQQGPTVTSQGAATVYGWGWPKSDMLLNDTWTASFNLVAIGPPYNVSYPLDACTNTASGCTGAVGGAGAASIADYKNYQGTPTTIAFPASDIYVVYPGMNVVVTPPFARGYPGFSQTFTAIASGGQPPYTYQWSVNSVIQASTSPTFSYTFPTVSTYTVRCLVHDQYSVQGYSAVSIVTIVRNASSLFWVQGNVTDSVTHVPIAGANVSLNGTSGSTVSGTVGNYQLGALVNGTYTLYVNASGYQHFAGKLTVLGDTWMNVALSAIPPSSYTISGYVTSYATGAALAGAAVSLTYYGSTFGSTTSNAQGAYALSGVLNATYTLSATLNGYNPTSLTVTVQGSSLVQNLSLAPLPPMAYYITGTISDNVTALPIAGALVSINTTAVLTNTTGTSGTYTLTPIYAGTYAISVSAPGYLKVSVVVTVSTYSVTQDIQLGRPPTPTYSVAGTVLDASSHQPIGSAKVQLSTTSWKVVATTLATSGGDFLLSGLLNGTYFANVSATGYSPVSRGVLIQGMSRSENFNLTPNGGGQVKTFLVQGTVTDARTGAFLQGVAIDVPLLGNTTSSAAGGFSYPAAPNGPYTYSASLPGFQTANGSFSVNGAPVDLNVSLTPLSSVTLYTLSGLVYDQASGTGLSGATVKVLNATTPPVPPTSTIKGGGFTLSVPNGHYEIEASDAQYQPAFANLTVKGAAVSGVVLYLTPEIPSGGSPRNTEWFISPGPFGLYLQIWVPLVGGLATFAIGLTALRRRHPPVPPKEEAGKDGAPSGTERPDSTPSHTPPPSTPGNTGGEGSVLPPQ